MMVSITDCFTFGKHTRAMGKTYCDEFRTGSQEMAILVAKLAHEEALTADTFVNKILFVPKTTLEVVWYALKLVFLITLAILKAVFGAQQRLGHIYMSLGDTETYDDEMEDDIIPEDMENEGEEGNDDEKREALEVGESETADLVG